MAGVKRKGHNLTMAKRGRLGRYPLRLPYGTYTRFILLFLQSEAIRTGSREIELGRGMPMSAASDQGRFVSVIAGSIQAKSRHRAFEPPLAASDPQANRRCLDASTAVDER